MLTCSVLPEMDKRSLKKNLRPALLGEEVLYLCVRKKKGLKVIKALNRSGAIGALSDLLSEGLRVGG